MTMPNEEEVVDLEVGGKNPVKQVKAMLSGYDIDDSDVSRISIQVYEPAPKALPEAPNGTEESTGSGGVLTDADRALKSIKPNSSHHLVLKRLEDADEPLAAVDIDVAADTNNVSTVLSKLYQRRLADRDASSMPYSYWPTDYGIAQLDEHGRDVTGDDVGGIWADG